MFPPLIENLEFLVFSRQVNDKYITLYFPNGNSYYLDVEEIKNYLRLSGIEESVFDHAWNFYHIYYDLETRQIIQIKEDDVSLILTGEKKVSELPFVLVMPVRTEKKSGW